MCPSTMRRFGFSRPSDVPLCIYCTKHKQNPVKNFALALLLDDILRNLRNELSMPTLRIRREGRALTVCEYG